MTLTKMSHLRRTLSVTLAVAATIALAACQPVAPASMGVTTSPGVRALQQSRFLKASLYGMMQLDFEGTSVTYPTSLGVPSVPVAWMGPIFSGKLEKAGPGQDMTIQVHGSVSDDGAWVNTMSYSKLIVTRTNITMLSYEVRLRNVPVTAVAGEAGGASFEKKGPEVRKHVEGISYGQTGTLSGTQKDAPTTFKSIDWAGTGPGQEPILKLVFETEASEDAGSLSPGGGM